MAVFSNLCYFLTSLGTGPPIPVTGSPDEDFNANVSRVQHRADPPAKYKPAELFDLQPGAFFGWSRLWKDKLKQCVWRLEARSKVMFWRGFLGIELRKLPFCFES